jgi:Tol biopolymer transport system component
MGEVYEALDTRLDRTVALKILKHEHANDPVWRERFDREARAISALNHPHICALYDIGHQDGIDFLVMEHCSGETLADRLARRPLHLDEVLRYGIALAEALAAAHGHGIVHRDLKPTNIIVAGGRSGDVKLLDFGVAKWRQAEVALEPSTADASSLTADGAFVGTLNYMAPEQLEGKNVDARTDVFALGAVLYEMLTGTRAFSGESRASVIAAVLEHEPAPMRPQQTLVPASVDRVVRKCLAKDPNQRWQTERDLADELSWIRDSHAADRSSGPVGPRHRSQLWLWTAAVLCLVAAGAFLASRAPRANETGQRPVQFEVLPPPGSVFVESSAFLAVAPDGRSIAFTASREGKRALWVRPLDGSAARYLEGTEGAGQPFWSPDSRNIAFWSEGKLRRIDVSDGTLQEIADAPLIQTGTWNAAGMILFNRSDAAGRAPLGSFEMRNRLYLASASGGARPLPSASVRAWPSFLPDGGHYLYLTRTDQGNHDRGGMLYVGSLDSTDARPVVASDSQGVLAAPDHLLYRQRNTLFAQAFDVARQRVVGEPHPVAEMVERTSGSRRGAFSVSQTGVLAYRRVGGTELVWFDRNGKRLGTVGPPGRYANPALSTDNRHLAVARLDPDRGTFDIWVAELTRNVMSRFTLDPAHDDMPIWSPDSSTIAFSSTRGTSVGIYQKAASGGGTEELLVGGLTQVGSTPVTWLPDGRTILFATSNESARAIFWLQPRTPPGVATRVFENETAMSSSCALSPDGRWAAFVSEESGRNEVYVRRFPTGDGKWQISVDGGVEPRWRDDGKELFYLAPDRSLMAVPIRTGVTVDAGQPIRLFETLMSSVTTGGYTRNQYVVGAKGEKFLVNQTTGSFPAPITVLVNWNARLRK